MRNWVWVWIAAVCLEALPVGMEIVEGSADGAGPWIETEGKTVLSWERFSLGRGETLHFAQRGENPAVLNRVRGAEKSLLEGTLTSNGEVFLINPHGILIGKEGRIETAGFIASTLDVEDALFLAGKEFVLKGSSSAEIVQEGRIVCKEGRVLLAAQGIASRGEIQAASIGLVASEAVWVQPAGTERQFLRGSTEGKREPPWICHTGVLDASSAEEGPGGEIYLFAEGGRSEVLGDLLARSERGEGGFVFALGEEVILAGSAACDVSGYLGGGSALFGGDFQGKNPKVPNAKRVFASEESRIFSDALHKGDGGKIIVWADETAVYDGQGSVRGGPFGGNGGFAEVSGKEGLFYRGFIERRAPLGLSGTLLLDPCTVTISGAATTGGVTFSGGNYTFPSLSSANINSGDLQTNLNAGHVTIDASATGTGGAGTGSITVASGVTVSWGGANILELQADTGGVVIGDGGAATFEGTANGILTVRSDGDISLNGTLSMAGTGTISLVAEDSVSIASGSTIECTGVGSGGSIQISAIAGTMDLAGTISTGTASAMNIFSFETLTIDAGTAISGAGDITMISLNNALTFNGASSSVTSSGAGHVSVLSAGEMTIDTGTTISSQGGAVEVRSGSPIVFAGTGGSPMTISTNGSGTITIEGGEGFPTPSANWPIELLSGSNLQVTSVNGNISITGVAGGSVGAVAFAPTGASTSNISCSGTGSITITASSPGTAGDAAFLLGSSGGGGVCRLTTNSGDISITATLSGTGSITGSSGALRINAANALASTSGDITLSGTGQGSGSGGSNNYGVRIDASPFSTPTTGAVSITGAGGGGSTSHGVYLLSSLTTTGTLTIDGTAGGGANSFGLYLAGSLTTSGGAIQIGNTIALDADLSVSSTGGGGSADIVLQGAVSNFSGNRALTLAAGGSGSVTLGGSLGSSSSRMGLTLSSMNALSLGGSIFLNNVAFNPPGGIPLTLTADVVIDAVAQAITIPSTVAGTTTGAEDFTLTTTGALSLGGDLGTNLVSLGVVTCTAGASGLSIGSAAENFYTTGFVVGGSIPTTLNNTSLLTIEANGGSISMGGTVNGAHGLALNSAAGALSLGASVGGSTPLTSFTLAGSTLSLGGSITASGAIDMAAATTLTNASTITSSGSTVDLNTSTFNGAQIFNISASGAVTIGGAVGNSVPVTLFSATGSSLSLGGGTIAAGSGGASFTGPVTLATQALTVNTSSGNGNISFSSTINGALGLTLNAGSGEASYGGAIGGITPVTSFSATASLTAASSNITTVNGGSIAFTGAVSLGNSVVFSTGAGAGSFSVSSGTITGGQAMTVTTGAAVFGGAVGSPTPLTSIAVNANTIGVNGAHTVTAGPMAYSGAVTLNGTQVFTNQGALGVTFSSTITGNHPLTIRSDNGAVAVTGAVNTSGSSGGAVTVEAAGNILFSSSIQATSSGGGTGGEVRLISSGGTVTVQSISN